MTARQQLGIWSNETFGAFHSRNYRLYLFGLVVSVTGTFMQQVAEGWLIYRLTNSAFAVGFVGFIVMIPLIPWVLLSGILADRMPRRTLLLITQVGQIVPPLALAFLVWSNLVQVWQIVIFDVVMAAMSALDQPVRQALVVETTAPEFRDNAIALSGAGFSLGRILGPAIAGVVVATWGETVCFILNGLSFLAVALALLAMRLPPKNPAPRSSLRASVGDTWRYLRSLPAVIAVLAMVAIVNLFAVPYQTLLPVFARDILRGGAFGLGLLVAATGGGAIIGSLTMARVQPGQRGLLALLLSAAACLFLYIYTLADSLLVASAVLMGLSSTVVACKVLAYVFVQGQVRDEFRGRMLSLLVLFDAGFPRLGGLGAGMLATHWSPTFALQLSAVGGLIFTLGLGWIAPQLRRLK